MTERPLKFTWTALADFSIIHFYCIIYALSIYYMHIIDLFTHYLYIVFQIQFKSDSSVADKGFSLTYSAKNANGASLPGPGNNNISGKDS